MPRDCGTRWQTSEAHQRLPLLAVRTNTASVAPVDNQVRGLVHQCLIEHLAIARLQQHRIEPDQITLGITQAQAAPQPGTELDPGAFGQAGRSP